MSYNQENKNGFKAFEKYWKYIHMGRPDMSLLLILSFRLSEFNALQYHMEVHLISP